MNSKIRKQSTKPLPPKRTVTRQVSIHPFRLGNNIIRIKTNHNRVRLQPNSPFLEIRHFLPTTNCSGLETSRNNSSAMRVDLLPQMDEKPFAGRRKKRVTTSKFLGRASIRILYVGHGLF